MTRTLLSLTIPFFAALTLCACMRDINASLDVSYPNLQSARGYAAQAITDLHKGRTDLAKSNMDIALEQAPNDPLVLDAMGYYLEKGGDVDGANDYFFKALAIAPQSGTIRNNYGAFLCRNGYSLESINYFLQASGSPGYTHGQRAYANARYCSQALGDNTESAYYKKLLWETSPQSIYVKTRY